VERKRVGVLDEQEIFRLGVVAALDEDPSLTVVFAAAGGSGSEKLDVAVVSLAAARAGLGCPLVVLVPDEPALRIEGLDVQGAVALLRRTTLTVEQLIATVRAAAAGLRVESHSPQLSSPRPTEARRREVLRLLAQGADTQGIATRLGYSQRTIKTYIQEIEQQLGVKTRAQAVAEGIRRGLI
jgi:DNA-binding NarL/FixJ family response regulator